MLAALLSPTLFALTLDPPKAGKVEIMKASDVKPGMQAIASVTELRELRMTGTAVTGRNLEMLKPLAKLERLPISSWNYRGEAASERHLGPVAEDFHAAFGLGASDHYIAPADEAGVALASVKALQEQLKARDREVEQLEQRLRALEARLDHASK